MHFPPMLRAGRYRSQFCNEALPAVSSSDSRTGGQRPSLNLALGAQKRDVLRYVLGQGMKLAALSGVLIGAAASLVVTRLLGSLLFSVSANDPTTFLLVALVLVALLACWLPAQRATKVEPIIALRCE